MIGIENKIVDPKVMPVVVVRRKERLQSALDAATESPNVVSTGYGPLMSSFKFFTDKIISKTQIDIPL